MARKDQEREASRRNILQIAGVVAFVPQLGVQSVSAKEKDELDELTESLDRLVRRHGGIKQGHKTVYKDENIVYSSNKKKKGQEKYVGAKAPSDKLSLVHQIIFNDGERETITCVVLDQNTLQIRLNNYNKKYKITLGKEYSKSANRKLDRKLSNLRDRRKKEQNFESKDISKESTIEVELGSDKQIFNSASDGESGESGIGGEVFNEYKPDGEPPEAQAGAMAVGAGTPTAYAEVWQDIYVSGSGSSQAIIDVSGYYEAAMTGVGGGSEAIVDVFVRGKNQTLDERSALNETGPILGTWQDNKVYTESLVCELEANNFYEIGIRTEAAANALALPSTEEAMEEPIIQSTGICDIERDHLHGNYFSRYSTIDIQFVS